MPSFGIKSEVQDDLRSNLIEDVVPQGADPWAHVGFQDGLYVTEDETAIRRKVIVLVALDHEITRGPQRCFAR